MRGIRKVTATRLLSHLRPGEGQAAAIGRRHWVPRQDHRQIHASDLKRAAETAHIIGEACAVEVCVDRALREVDVGNWAGLTHAEAKERFPEGYARRRAGGTGWGGGESYEQMAVRVRGYVGRLLDSARGSDRIALICHSGVIRVLVVHALGLTPSDRRSIGGNEHGALSVLRVRKGAVVAPGLQRCLPSARRGSASRLSEPPRAGPSTAVAWSLQRVPTTKEAARGGERCDCADRGAGGLEEPEWCKI